MFHICSPGSRISMTMSSQCFNDVQSSGWEWGSSPVSEGSLAPARCPKPRTQKQWTQGFNRSPFSGANHSRKGFVVGLERVRLVFLQWAVALPSPFGLHRQAFLKRPLLSFPPNAGLWGQKLHARVSQSHKGGRGLINQWWPCCGSSSHSLSLNNKDFSKNQMAQWACTRSGLVARWFRHSPTWRSPALSAEKVWELGSGGPRRLCQHQMATCQECRFSALPWPPGSELRGGLSHRCLWYSSRGIRILV